MSKLADLLGTDHPLFSYNIAQLEKASGNAGVDTKLIADVTHDAHAIIRKLGLVPSDTLPVELYQAINAAVRRDQARDILKADAYTIALVDGEPISLNLQDAIENSHHEIHFSERKSDHAKRQLRAEVVKRYADHDRTSNKLVRELAEEAGLVQEDDEEYKSVASRFASASNETAKPSILCIGDIFTDAFIKLGDDVARVIKDDEGVEWLGVPYGRKPPYERVDIVKSVGPSPNAAVSCQRLGLNASLMAWVGDDETGKEALDYLHEQNVGTDDMVTQKDKLTSYWYVLSYKADRTMLIKSEKYDYGFEPPREKPDWIYLSYLGEASWPLHEQLLEYLEKNSSVKLAFQPGTFQFKWGAEKLAGLYRRSYITIMNREEAMEVTGEGYDDLHKLADSLHDLGPEIVVITDGPNGSYASYDGRLMTIPNYPDIAPPLERTGAGDAFASTIVSALALGKTMDEALLLAPINSMNVVQKIGAQAGLQTMDQIEKWLEKAPDNYKITEA